MISITVGIRVEFDMALVEAAGSPCPVCQDPMFGEMVAVRVFFAMDNGTMEHGGTVPTCCTSCAGDERIMRLPCHPDAF